ncbi:MAG TPA: hypothetical protein ENO30_02465 [Thermodesulfobium narugense]|nr:hypothetical protein [Thermodesulfobium narugense]
MNAEFAYLLGMITGKGAIIRENTYTEIRIEIPHKNLIIEGQNANFSVRASITNIRDILEPLINTRIETNSLRGRTILSFRKDNRDYIIREINRHFNHELVDCRDFRIPDEVFSSSEDIKREFLRGIADVTGHIRSSNNYMCKREEACFGHRVYIEIPVNWFLVIDIANLLMELDIPVHTIDWAHPNMRDPHLRDYNSGRINAWFREHQIKIFAEEFERVGFQVIHKMHALERLANTNRENWNIYVRNKIASARNLKDQRMWESRLNNIESKHHRYYWESRENPRRKPLHPMENDQRIPEVIRGRHFDSWREIAEALGYPRNGRA